MATLDYNSIYALQDKVLENIFLKETTFYLTGGTCLNRFYYNRRYSDDLDLFTNDNAFFRDDVRIIIEGLKSSPLSYNIKVDTRDFVRLNINENLQVDMVNDRVYRHGKSVHSPSGVVLDNILNICANKLCAIIGRDDPKDMFDIYTIYKNENLDWNKAIDVAKKKCIINSEVFEYRLSTFPLDLLDMLKVTDLKILADMKEEYPDIAKYLIGL